jgi:hypothetical protein
LVQRYQILDVFLEHPVEQNVTARMVSGKMERVVTNHYKLKVGDVEYGVLKKDIQDLVALYQANLPPN